MRQQSADHAKPAVETRSLVDGRAFGRCHPAQARLSSLCPRERAPSTSPSYTPRPLMKTRRRLIRAHVGLNSRTVMRNSPGSKIGSRARSGSLSSQIVEPPESWHSCRAATPLAPWRRQKLAGVHIATSGGCPVADSTEVRMSSSTGKPRGTTSLVESNPTVAWTKMCETEADRCAGVR
jgi:hypothetical protein